MSKDLMECLLLLYGIKKKKMFGQKIFLLELNQYTIITFESFVFASEIKAIIKSGVYRTLSS